MYDKLQQKCRASLLYIDLFSKMGSAIFYMMECAVKELCTVLASLERGVVLKVTDYLGDCMYCMVYSPYIIICWWFFRCSFDQLHICMALTTQVVLL